MKCLGEQLQQVQLQDGKNVFMRNKIPKLLLVLLVAHQTILQILITRVHFPVFIAPIPHVPHVVKICLSLSSVIIDHQFPPGNLSSSLFRITLPKNTKTSAFAQFPTGLLNFNLVCSVALVSELIGGDAQDGPYQEESERPWRSKVTSRITSWEGQRGLCRAEKGV